MSTDASSAPQLEEAKRRLQLVQQEFDSQLRLLDLEVAEAQEMLRAAVEQLDLIDKQIELGDAPIAQRVEPERERIRADFRLQQALTLRELYRTALKADGGTAADGPSAPNGDQTKPEGEPAR